MPFSVLLLTLSLAADAPPSNPVLFRTQSRVEVDAMGKVTGVAPTPSLSPAINETIAASIRRIRFAPPTRDGHAVSGVTWVRMDACAVPMDGNYRFSTSFRGNGPSQEGDSAPRYPLQALRDRAKANVTVTYRVGEEGAATVEKVAVTGRGHRYEHEITAAVSDWIAHLRFVPELLDGRPVSTRLSTVIAFAPGETMYFSSSASARKYYAKKGEADRLRTALANPTCEAAMAPGPDDTRTVALDSPFQPLPVD